MYTSDLHFSDFQFDADQTWSNLFDNQSLLPQLSDNSISQGNDEEMLEVWSKNSGNYTRNIADRNQTITHSPLQNAQTEIPERQAHEEELILFAPFDY